MPHLYHPASEWISLTNSAHGKKNQKVSLAHIHYIFTIVVLGLQAYGKTKSYIQMWENIP